MKSLMCLLQEVLLDRGTWCGTSTTLDFKRIERRVKHEGISFITITLPIFGKDLERALDQGFVDRHLFRGYPWKGGLPVFLGGFLDLVFDRSTGCLLPVPNVDAIQAIRQIALMFAKINLPCSKERERAAIAKYLQCEQDVQEADANRSEEDISRFERIGRLLWSDVLQLVDEDIYYGRLVPKHGPGTTADKLVGNVKYDQTEWTSRLEPLFPHGEFLAPNWRHFGDLDHVDILEPEAERPVKVITVPKTLKTPRIIAVEPTCMQYTQQALLESLVGYLEDSDSNPHSNLIGFQDQNPNRRMALEGSHRGNLATLDLSEASDRVSNQLVQNLVTPFPHVGEALDATRSRNADVLGEIIKLHKFASMGSALCFPVEAMVFATIIFCGIEKELKHQLTKRDIKSFSREVRVYGDDIIVPVEFVQAVVNELEAFGLKVNVAKSFWTGKFRESCGREYYDGQDVSIVRIRELLPTKRQDASQLISTVSLRNQLYLAGYWGVAEYLDMQLMTLIRHYPVIKETSPVLGRFSYLGYQSERLHQHLHSPLVRGHVVSAIIPPRKLEGIGALEKFFLKRGNQPLSRDHLERSGRPKSVSTKLRWAQPF